MPEKNMLLLSEGKWKPLSVGQQFSLEIAISLEHFDQILGKKKKKSYFVLFASLYFMSVAFLIL